MKKITLLIKDQQHKRLSERSKKTETTISEQIRQAIEKYLKEVSSGKEM